MTSDPQAQHFALMAQICPQLRRQDSEDFYTWQRRARMRLSELLGLPFELCQPELEIEWTRETDGCRELRISFCTEAHYRALAHLLIPHHEAPVPVVICLQGHSKGMHISLGRPKYPGDEATISGGDRDFARQVVARGLAALVLEQRGFGECGGTADGPACQQPAMAALLLGRTLLGERVWDVMRAVDLISEDFPELDSRRIAIMGNSGGGTASIYAAALDTRIAAAMPSCAFCGYEASIGAQLHCVCNYVPGIMRYFDMGDLAGLIAPRPLVIVNGLHDDIFPIDAARAQYDVAREYYAAIHAEEKLRHVVGPEGHRFYADQGWTAFADCTNWPIS